MNTNRPLPQLPPRRPESHKGDYGRALLLGGSRGMSGAVALAGQAALRGGAGLVRLAVPEACLDTVASFEPSYMTSALPCDTMGRIDASARPEIARLLQTATAAACGPGLGRSETLDDLVAWLYQHANLALVVDADGLNALANRPDALAQPAGPRVLTPHPGEFRRLADALTLPRGIAAEEQAARLAEHCQAVVVLKSHRTLVVAGEDRIRNSTGNPGMATGGCGDVLTGLITALLCQGLAPIDAAQLGVHLHGLAGDLAAADLGQISLIASDLIRYLPRAFQSLEASS